MKTHEDTDVGHFQDLAAPTKVEFLNEDEADDDRKTAIVDISMGW